MGAGSESEGEDPYACCSEDVGGTEDEYECCCCLDEEDGEG
jgi:hypothetical protein